jgi:hypothetical protein
MRDVDCSTLHVVLTALVEGLPASDLPAGLWQPSLDHLHEGSIYSTCITHELTASLPSESGPLTVHGRRSTGPERSAQNHQAQRICMDRSLRVLPTTVA